jgi:hypothetical protein
LLHQNGSLVTTTNPAQIGETVSVYGTGLGAVNPTIANGAAGPSSPLSYAANTITADISGVTATVTFAGLAPGLAGLYQVNVTMPSGLTAGDNYLDLAGPEAWKPKPPTPPEKKLVNFPKFVFSNQPVSPRKPHNLAQGKRKRRSCTPGSGNRPAGFYRKIAQKCTRAVAPYVRLNAP